jgi:hypothetical protein
MLSLEESPPTGPSSEEEKVVPSVFSHPEWDPDSHFRRALPSATMQKEFKFVLDLHAFDEDGVEVPCEAMEVWFKEGLAVMGTVSLHLCIN